MNNREKNILYEQIKNDKEAVERCLNGAACRGTNYIREKYNCDVAIARAIVNKIRAKI